MHTVWVTTEEAPELREEDEVEEEEDPGGGHTILVSGQKSGSAVQEPRGMRGKN